MNYRLRDNNASRSNARNRWIAFGALAVVLLALRFFAPDMTSRAVQFVFAPFMRSGAAVSGIAADAGAGMLESKQQLLADNAELRQELADSSTELALAKGLQVENDQLRKQLDLTKATDQTAALVLSKPPQSPYDTLVIEFGPGKQVAAGDKVYADGTTLLGEVTEAGGTTATVKLYSTAGNEIEATIERNSIAEKLVGAGGGNFEIKAPKEVDIATGDVLVVPGIDKKVLGIVRQIDTQPTDSFQHVLVASPVNIFQIKWVTIDAKK